MTKIIENYCLEESIGEGQYGKVYKAHDTKNPQNLFAIKVVKIQKFKENPKLEECTINEIRILSKVEANQHVVKFVELLKTSNNYYFVYEFCSGGTLDQLILNTRFLEEKKANLFLAQLFEAFKTLSKYHILHRDLKPTNILYHEGIIKLADFGFCRPLKYKNEMVHTMLGSPIYMAPEVLRGQEYCIKADIWSLGVVYFEMLFGYCPFEERSIAKLIMLLEDANVKINRKINNISPEAEELLKVMLIKNPENRISWEELFELYQITPEGKIIAPTKQQKENTEKKFLKQLPDEYAQLKPKESPQKKRYEMQQQAYKNYISPPIPSLPTQNNNYLKPPTQQQQLPHIQQQQQQQQQYVQPQQQQQQQQFCQPIYTNNTIQNNNNTNMVTQQIEKNNQQQQFQLQQNNNNNNGIVQINSPNVQKQQQQSYQQQQKQVYKRTNTILIPDTKMESFQKKLQETVKLAEERESEEKDKEPEEESDSCTTPINNNNKLEQVRSQNQSQQKLKISSKPILETEEQNNNNNYEKCSSTRSQQKQQQQEHTFQNNNNEQQQQQFQLKSYNQSYNNNNSTKSLNQYNNNNGFVSNFELSNNNNNQFQQQQASQQQQISKTFESEYPNIPPTLMKNGSSTNIDNNPTFSAKTPVNNNENEQQQKQLLNDENNGKTQVKKPAFEDYCNSNSVLTPQTQQQQKEENDQKNNDNNVDQNQMLQGLQLILQERGKLQFLYKVLHETSDYNPSEEYTVKMIRQLQLASLHQIKLMDQSFIQGVTSSLQSNFPKFAEKITAENFENIKKTTQYQQICKILREEMDSICKQKEVFKSEFEQCQQQQDYDDNNNSDKMIKNNLNNSEDNFQWSIFKDTAKQYVNICQKKEYDFLYAHMLKIVDSTNLNNLFSEFSPEYQISQYFENLYLYSKEDIKIQFENKIQLLQV